MKENGIIKQKGNRRIYEKDTQNVGVCSERSHAF